MSYSNNLYLSDMKDVSKSVWKIGRNFFEGRNPHVKYPGNLRKLFYLTYLTGSRIGELVREPYPLLQIYELEGIHVMSVKKLNEKHFTTREPLNQNEPVVRVGGHVLRRKLNLETSIRQQITQNLPIDNEYEARMWNYVTRDYTQLNTRAWLQSFGGYKSRESISHRFSRLFKANLMDEKGNAYPNHGINPHMLRHLRAYNLVQKGYEERLIQQYFGWVSRDMLYHYTYIKRLIEDKEQREIVRRMLKKEKDD